jgi:UTP--glucose-1-phosphate uridylyltransferase
MLPLVDKPVIQYSIEEAVAAGIEHVVVVTSSQKRPIEDHFDHNYELEQMLEEKGDIDNLREIRQIGDMVQISYVRQKEQLGLGHAVLMAKEAIGHEPFAVMLPDDVVVGDRPCIGQLIDAYNRTHGSVVAVMEVPDSEVSRYGVIDPDSDAETNDERLFKVQRLVEKPEAGSAPSNLAIIGRYVLTPKIFERLESTSRGAGGEIQLTDAISSLISDEQDVYAYAFEGKRYDAGTTMGWLQASVELALERPDIGGEFRRFLSGLDLS